MKVLAIISHSLGELDVLFPLFAGLKNDYNLEIELLITVRVIYQKYLKSDFYRSCAKELKCRVTYFRLANKFDPEFRFLKCSRLERMLRKKLYYYFIFLWRTPSFMKRLFWADVYMHEFSNQLKNTRPVYWANRVLGKSIFVYSHAHSVTLDTRASRKVPYANRTTFLLFHKHNRKFMNDLGYANCFTIGYPKFWDEWISLVRKYQYSRFKKQNIAVIYSRSVHPYYMDMEKYENLIVSSCEVIRKRLGDVPIVIKPHPREDETIIRNVLQREGIFNAEISWEHAAVLAKQAVLTISFWTSAILDSLAMGIPSVEYYIEAERFREAEPGGSAYRKLGIDSVDNKVDLESFVDRVLDMSYEVPSIIGELAKVRDLGFLRMAL